MKKNKYRAQDVDDNAFPASMEIDYIRVYKMKE